MSLLKDDFGWFVVGLLFLEVLAMFLLATPESAKVARDKEHQSAITILGEERAMKARAFAQTYFSRHFIETGLVKNVQATLVPSEEKKARANLSHFMTDMFGWVQARLEGVWAMFYSSYHRLYIMGFVMMFAIPAIPISMIDGITERDVTIRTNGVATPVYFHAAKRVLTVMLIMPLFILFLPFTVNVAIWFLWVVALPILVWVATKNVQEL